MQRRVFLAVLGTAGAVGTAGCGTVRSKATLSDPSVYTDAPREWGLDFESNGERIGSFGVRAGVSSGTLDLQTQIWHRSGTEVESIELEVWMPSTETGSTTEVAVVSPVSGDASPPPSVSLSPADRGPGTEIGIDDLDDLEDDTIRLDLIVRPGSTAATTLVIEPTIELTSTDWLRGGYTLEGRLRMEFPELNGR